MPAQNHHTDNRLLEIMNECGLFTSHKGGWAGYRRWLPGVYRKDEQFGCQIAQPRRKWDLAELSLTHSKQKAYSRLSWGRHSAFVIAVRIPGVHGKSITQTYEETFSSKKNFCFFWSLAKWVAISGYGETAGNSAMQAGRVINH